MKNKFYGLAVLLLSVVLMKDDYRICITGTIKNGMVQLHCNADDLNPPFLIERSFDGERWGPIALINNAEGSEFNYTDSIPVNGLSFYRVTTDNPLSITSNYLTMVVEIEKYTVRPAIGNPRFSICSEMPADVRIQILSLSGALEKEFTTRLTKSPMELDLSSMQKGAYVLRIRDTERTYGFKLFVL